MKKLILKLGQNIAIGLMGVMMMLEIQVNATESANPEVLKDISDIELSQKNGFDNVVVGKAIYENKISLESLIKFNA